MTAVDGVDVLGVLATNLKDGVDGRVDLHGTRDVSSDLVDNEVSAADSADNLTARAGGTEAGDIDLNTVLGGHLAHGLEEKRRGAEGVTARLTVDVKDGLLVGVNE